MRKLIIVIAFISLVSCSDQKTRYIRLGKSKDAILFLDTKNNRVLSVEMDNRSISLETVDLP